MKSYNAVKSDYDLQKDARRDADYLCQVDRRQVDRHEKEEKTAHPRAYVHSTQRSSRPERAVEGQNTAIKGSQY